MTQIKAETVAAAIIGAGFAATAYIRSDGEWVVRASSSNNRAVDFSIPTASANALAVSQTITGSINSVEYV